MLQDAQALFPVIIQGALANDGSGWRIGERFICATGQSFLTRAGRQGKISDCGWWRIWRLASKMMIMVLWHLPNFDWMEFMTVHAKRKIHQSFIHLDKKSSLWPLSFGLKLMENALVTCVALRSRHSRYAYSQCCSLRPWSSSRSSVLPSLLRRAGMPYQCTEAVFVSLDLSRLSA